MAVKLIDTNNDGDQSFLAQTDAQMVGYITDTMQLFIKHMFPLEPVQQQKINGTKINLVGADKEANSHGAKVSGSNQGQNNMMNPMGAMGAAFGMPGMMGGSGSTEGFFGGSFFPQTFDEM